MNKDIVFSIEKLARAIRQPRRLGALLLDAACSRLLSPLSHRWRAGNVAMFHVGRCGSTVLGDLLHQHPDIYWNGEIYQRLIDKHSGLPPRSHPAASASELDAFLAEQMGRGYRCFYGFEVTCEHLRHLQLEIPDCIEYLLKHRITHFIILERKNYLKSIVSKIIAQRSNNWHISIDASPSLCTLNLDIDNVQLGPTSCNLVSAISLYHDFYATLATALKPCAVLHITYEIDIMENPKHAYALTCEFLGLPDHSACVHFNQTTPFELAEVISNFQDVRSALNGSGFEWMAEPAHSGDV